MDPTKFQEILPRVGPRMEQDTF